MRSCTTRTGTTTAAETIRARKVFQAKLALREIGSSSLLDALDYLDLLAELKLEKLEPAAIRWHGRF